MIFDNEKLAWMLGQLMDQPEVYDALLVSGDGLVRACTPGLDRDTAEQMAAALAGVQATSSASARLCRSEPDSWEQSLTQFRDGYVITIRAGDGSFLTTATSGSADVEAISFRMHQLVAQLGGQMTSEPRHDTGSPT
ncbi:MAG TPA: roadblock/LC7 domain-containing protein [Streptomyces sp.]|uniref:roadblock/LC7 domain-containing protein n=1 Tax=Streptomyces sp. TaxID=1931 RepID=UPI002D4FE5F5|nr:roadblock/LC7 domain-containing protein [Streptomyces sp.]HZG03717.1 roadblock/LC7 domain-containing protein [Streptomyces sp.]